MNTMTDERYLERLRLCVGLRQQGYYDEALKVAAGIASARPQESSVWHTLGQIHTDRGTFDCALACHQQAVTLIKSKDVACTHPKEFQTAALGLAYALMRAGRFEEAWPFWEAGRLGVSWSPWPGSKYYDGKTRAMQEKQPDSLLVQAEGGYGDLFMFMRWLPLLKTNRGVKRLGLMLWPRAQNLCDWSALGVDRVYRIGVDRIRFGQWQCATSIMTLPVVFGMRTWSDVPDTIDLTGSNPMRGLVVWSDLEGSPSSPCRIGFCWRSEENEVKTKVRSLPLKVASEVCRMLTTQTSGGPVEMYSLSIRSGDLYGGGYNDQPDCLKLEEEKQTNWYDTARYMCGMDFILTVDTAVAHLAGVLGLPTLVLLPRASSWQWGPHERTSGPWYGPELTYYRQPVPLQWDAQEIVKAAMARIR